MTSYQEIAYTISKNNRGYIYLVSILKASYLIVTCAYCLQFCAVFPVSLVLIKLNKNNDDESDGIIWSLLLTFLIFFGIIAGYFYNKQKYLH